MKLTIEIEIDDCYQEQIFKNAVFDQKENKRELYENSMHEHSLRAILEQTEIEISDIKHYNSDIEDIRIEQKIDFLNFCELDCVKIKVKI